MKTWWLFFSLILALLLVHPDQTTGLASSLAKSHTVTGFLCYSDSGANMGTDCLSTASGKICYVTQASIKYVGFRSKASHQMGAEYRVTFSSSAGVNYASKVVFTGRSNTHVERCRSS